MSAEALGPRFVRDAAALRHWFTAHHATQAALLAWTDVPSRPASFGKAAMRWIVGAKRDVTGLCRLPMRIDWFSHGEAMSAFDHR